MKMYVVKVVLLLGFACLFQGVVQAQVAGGFVIASAEGVTLDGEPVEDGDVFDLERAADYVFGEGASIDLRHSVTNVVYRLNSAPNLALFVTAFASGNGGVAIGRWAVGGDRQNMNISTVSSAVPDNVPNVAPQVTPSNAAATPVKP